MRIMDGFLSIGNTLRLLNFPLEQGQHLIFRTKCYFSGITDKQVKKNDYFEEWWKPWLSLQTQIRESYWPITYVTFQNLSLFPETWVKEWLLHSQWLKLFMVKINPICIGYIFPLRSYKIEDILEWIVLFLVHGLLQLCFVYV